MAMKPLNIDVTQLDPRGNPALTQLHNLVRNIGDLNEAEAIQLLTLLPILDDPTGTWNRATRIEQLRQNILLGRLKPMPQT